MSVKMKELENVNRSAEDLIAEVNAKLKAELEADQRACSEEVGKILEKYNLVQTPIVQQTWGPGGLVNLEAGIMLTRPQKKEGQNG